MIAAKPLSAALFARWGEVLDTEGEPDRLINGGLCGRFHDRARLEAQGGRIGLSLFRAEPRTLPYRLEMVERHVLGSQAFIPMTAHPFLVIVADDGPGTVHAFLTTGAQGINLRPGAWHAVLTPLHAPGLFAVIDRIADQPDVEEHWLPEPVTVTASG